MMSLKDLGSSTIAGHFEGEDRLQGAPTQNFWFGRYNAGPAGSAQIEETPRMVQSWAIQTRCPVLAGKAYVMAVMEIAGGLGRMLCCDCQRWCSGRGPRHRGTLVEQAKCFNAMSIHQCIEYNHKALRCQRIDAFLL